MEEVTTSRKRSVLFTQEEGEKTAEKRMENASAVSKRPKFEASTEGELPSVLLIGDPKLRLVSEEVADVTDAQFLIEKQQLQLVLEKVFY